MSSQNHLHALVRVLLQAQRRQIRPPLEALNRRHLTTADPRIILERHDLCLVSLSRALGHIT